MGYHATRELHSPIQRSRGSIQSLSGVRIPGSYYSMYIAIPKIPSLLIGNDPEHHGTHPFGCVGGLLLNFSVD